MGEAKVDIKIGETQFSGQGDQDWISKQLDKILAQAEKLLLFAPLPQVEQSDVSGHKPMGKDSTIAKTTLPSFLNEKGATKNQVKKFLATAVWLEAKGKNRLETNDITNALKESNQSRLGNAADCLNKNIAKGYCEKNGKQFFVTEDGKKSL